MRKKKLQKELDNMSLKEKMKRTTIEAFKKRLTLFKEYKYWYLTINEYPHKNRWELQLVLRKKDIDNEIDNIQSILELMAIREEFKSYHFLNSWTKSCPFREHWHIFEWGV